MGAPAASAVPAAADGPQAGAAATDRGPSGKRPTFERPGRDAWKAAQPAVPPTTPPAEPPAPAEDVSVLVFTETAGFRHSSIETGVAAVEAMGAEHGFSVDWADDSEGVFTAENLAGYDTVVWLSTTGDVLDEAEQEAFEDYVRAGGGYAGIYAASDTEYEWPWYGELVGAYFASHPQVQSAVVEVEDADHPSTAHLPERWERTDEWYSFRDNPRGDVHVLASLDESTYDTGSGAMGDHPIAWCHEHDGGRAWYTGLGHTEESWAEPEMLEHVLGGILSTAGAAEHDCVHDGHDDGDHGDHDPAPDAPAAEDFQQVTLARGASSVGEPMGLAVLDDRSVLHSSRDGRIWRTTPDALNSVVAQVPVYDFSEDGLQGIAVDPDFEENRWVYLYYSPVLDTPAGEAPTTGTPEDFAPFEGYNLLSRFQLGEDFVLDLASEQEILRVPSSRGICCHVGGEIDFDADGNLYLSTGDDTNPFASDAYAPIDVRPDRNPAFDAQRTSANTNDLRGKLLRITVQEDGSYTVPEGNLFAEGTDLTRPEIYAMGLRNPFRFSVDRRTGDVHLGDYGPDAPVADPARGPRSTVEFEIITGPANLGWPYCIGQNVPFVEYDFATGESGEPFDCDAPVNTSPNNTGLTELPPAKPAWLDYSGSEKPELGAGGESPMGAVVYDYDEALESPTKWPEYFDGVPLLYEWDRGWIREGRRAEDGSFAEIRDTLSFLELRRPMNVEFGPDGSLYVLDYGGSYFGGAPDSALYRVDHTQGANVPQAVASVTPSSGSTPLEVQLDATGTTHPNGLEMTYEWDVDNDGETDLTGPTGSWTYEESGQYTVRLVVTDSEGAQGVATATVTVGNTAPEVELTVPVDGGFFAFGDEVPFRVDVSDAEDGTDVDCSRVRVDYVLGHDSHGHPLSSTTGCEGVIATPGDGGHGVDANIFGVINATYTDEGAEGLPELTGSDQVVLNTKVKQVRYFADSEGVELVTAPGAVSGTQVAGIEDGDWVMFDPVNFLGVDDISLRYASGGAGGTVEVRSGAVDGELVATMQLAPTGGDDQYATSPAAEVTDPGVSGPVYLVFRGEGDEELFQVDQMTVTGPGVLLGDEDAGEGVVPTTTATTDPAAPDGLEGWFTTVPSVTLAVDGDAEDAGDVRVEYRVDDGEWATYTEPFAVPGDGTRLVTHRAVSVDGAVGEEQELLFSLDTTPPTTALEVRDGEVGAGGAVVVLTAEDATSGVAGTEYSLDGGDWQPYTGPVALTGAGERTVLYRSTDVAGNVEADQAATVVVDPAAPTLLVDGIADGVVYGTSTDVLVSWVASGEDGEDVEVTATLDGAPVRDGELVALHRLDLGLHELRVEAVGSSGGTATQVVSFATTTSMRDVGALLDRFRATNRLSLTAYSQLSTTLVDARVAEATADDAGAVRALGELTALVEDARLVPSADVRRVLLRDVAAVSAAIEGVGSLQAAVNATAAVTG
ncbi:ThuA domain-containing protein [Pseudokineococcus lusitanus]